MLFEMSTSCCLSLVSDQHGVAIVVMQCAVDLDSADPAVKDRGVRLRRRCESELADHSLTQIRFPQSAQW